MARKKLTSILVSRAGRKFYVKHDAEDLAMMPVCVVERHTVYEGHPYLRYEKNSIRWHVSSSPVPKRGLIAGVLRDYMKRTARVAQGR